MNYYKYYFVLQGVTVGLAGFSLIYFCESPFYSYKKKTLGHLYRICNYIISKNFEDEYKQKNALGEVQRLMGIDQVFKTCQENIYKQTINKNLYIEDNQEMSYFTLPDSSQK